MKCHHPEYVCKLCGKRQSGFKLLPIHEYEALEKRVEELDKKATWLEKRNFYLMQTTSGQADKVMERAEQAEAKCDKYREAARLVVDASDIMDDGPDESDKAMAARRLSTGVDLLKQALKEDTPV